MARAKRHPSVQHNICLCCTGEGWLLDEWPRGKVRKTHPLIQVWIFRICGYCREYIRATDYAENLEEYLKMVLAKTKHKIEKDFDVFYLGKNGKDNHGQLVRARGSK